MAEVAALPTLESFAPVDPGAEARERTLQRQHLAQAAAEIGTALPQRAVAVGQDEIVLRRGDAAHVAEAEPGEEFVAVGEGSREVLPGFREFTGVAGVNRGHGVGQTGEFGAVVGHLCERPAQTSMQVPHTTTGNPETKGAGKRSTG